MQLRFNNTLPFQEQALVLEASVLLAEGEPGRLGLRIPVHSGMTTVRCQHAKVNSSRAH